MVKYLVIYNKILMEKCVLCIQNTKICFIVVTAWVDVLVLNFFCGRKAHFRAQLWSFYCLRNIVSLIDFDQIVTEIDLVGWRSDILLQK